MTAIWNVCEREIIYASRFMITLLSLDALVIHGMEQYYQLGITQDSFHLHDGASTPPKGSTND